MVICIHKLTTQIVRLECSSGVSSSFNADSMTWTMPCTKKERPTYSLNAGQC
jgi:hypothetical protein